MGVVQPGHPGLQAKQLVHWSESTPSQVPDVRRGLLRAGDPPGSAGERCLDLERHATDDRVGSPTSCKGLREWSDVD